MSFSYEEASRLSVVDNKDASVAENKLFLEKIENVLFRDCVKVAMFQLQNG